MVPLTHGLQILKSDNASWKKTPLNLIKCLPEYQQDPATLTKALHERIELGAQRLARPTQLQRATGGQLIILTLAEDVDEGRVHVLQRNPDKRIAAAQHAAARWYFTKLKFSCATLRFYRVTLGDGSLRSVSNPIIPAAMLPFEKHR